MLYKNNIFFTVSLLVSLYAYSMEEKSLASTFPNEVLGSIFYNLAKQEISDLSSSIQHLNSKEKQKKGQNAAERVRLALNYNSKTEQKDILESWLPLVVELNPKKYGSTLNAYCAHFKIDPTDLNIPFTVGQWWKTLDEEKQDKTWTVEACNGMRTGTLRVPPCVTSLREFNALRKKIDKLDSINIYGKNIRIIEADAFNKTNVEVLNIYSNVCACNKSLQLKGLGVKSATVQKNIDLKTLENLIPLNNKLKTLGLINDNDNDDENYKQFRNTYIRAIKEYKKKYPNNKTRFF